MKRHLSIAVVILGVSLSSAYAAMGTVPDTTAPQYNFRLTFEDTEQAVSQALAEKGAGTKIAATITGNRSQPLFSYDKPISVEIRGLTFDKTAAHWSANVLFMDEKAAVISALPVAGKFDEVAELPVLKRAVRSGETIRQEDIELQDYPVSRTRSDAISDMTAMVGKTPIRTISAGRPIRENEVAVPAVVKKNAIVQMSYVTPGMQITTSGQALAEGSPGQVIAVRNLASKKMVYAVVENESMVKIVPAGSQAISQLNEGAGYETN